MGSGEGKTVCGTGASGYIASCLVKQLLLRGYTVKASVRDPGQFFIYIYQFILVLAELLDPAVKGTLNVLNSCANSSSIKRVVLTSIIVAVTYNGKRRTPNVVDESWFTDLDYCRGLKVCVYLCYLLSCHIDIRAVAIGNHPYLWKAKDMGIK
ncbi:hypothetical protein Godav_015635 [Gossypium davidsonii]|uniref:NAD(P)-binding domain-containing protein n=1 Tax=Gossypium davidsonii TaxID=34287 RepID=A0A7J8RNR5_GOSDV|nr:hypothetical protein [Gossypium davidsonii]